MFDRNYNIISQYLTSIRVQVVLFLTHHTYILNISFLIYVLITTKEESFCYLLDNESGVEMLIWTLNYHSIWILLSEGALNTLVMYGPAWPYWHKSSINRCFKTNILSWLAKHPYYARDSHWSSIIKLPLSYKGVLEMGSFLIIVVKIYRYIDGDVENLRKFECFYDYFRQLCNTWIYGLTRNLILFRPVMKVNI